MSSQSLLPYSKCHDYSVLTPSPLLDGVLVPMRKDGRNAEQAAPRKCKNFASAKTQKSRLVQNLHFANQFPWLTPNIVLRNGGGRCCNKWSCYKTNQTYRMTFPRPRLINREINKLWLKMNVCTGNNEARRFASEVFQVFDKGVLNRIRLNNLFVTMWCNMRLSTSCNMFFLGIPIQKGWFKQSHFRD